MALASPPDPAADGARPAPARAGVKLFFDGGCRGRSGHMETAVVTGGHATFASDLGEGTSSDAEWLALIAALARARQLGLTGFVLIGDSADIVAKANGVIPCRGRDAAHCARFRQMAADAGPFRIRHVRRSQNLAGIALQRRYPR